MCKSKLLEPYKELGGCVMRQCNFYMGWSRLVEVPAMFEVRRIIEMWKSVDWNDECFFLCILDSGFSWCKSWMNYCMAFTLNWERIAKDTLHSKRFKKSLVYGIFFSFFFPSSWIDVSHASGWMRINYKDWDNQLSSTMSSEIWNFAKLD